MRLVKIPPFIANFSASAELAGSGAVVSPFLSHLPLDSFLLALKWGGGQLLPWTAIPQGVGPGLFDVDGSRVAKPVGRGVRAYASLEAMREIVERYRPGVGETRGRGGGRVTLPFGRGMEP